MPLPAPTSLSILLAAASLTLAAGAVQAADAPAGPASPAAPPVVSRPVAKGPSFACKPTNTAAQKAICADSTLAALDRKLAGIVSMATRQEPAQVGDQSLAVVQRQWQQDRDGCAREADVRKCLSSVYRTRIAEVQGQYRLVAARGPFRWACTGADVATVVMTYFETDPPSASMESDKGVNLMFVAPSASGARYVGDGVQYWEHQGVATVSFAGAPEATCKQAS